MDIHAARENMIKQQIRTCDILESDEIKLLSETPREYFVPQEYSSLAFSDTNIPIGHHQCMLTPLLEAKIIQALTIKSTDKVLEVGTGSGYMTALLAKLSKHVYTVDVFTDFLHIAEKKLSNLGLHNVTFESGSAAKGWQKHQPYDVIALTGALPILPENFLKQLTVGGRLFAILGKAPAMKAVLVKRLSENEWQSQELFETDVPYLYQAEEPEKFTF